MNGNKTETLYYILFYNYTDGIALARHLKESGVPSKVSTVPRDVSSACGMAVSVEPGDLAATRDIIEKSGIEIEKIVPVERRVFKRKPISVGVADAGCAGNAESEGERHAPPSRQA